MQNHHDTIQIRQSVKANMNIFSLSQAIVYSTPCRPTVQLCARVALMVSDLYRFYIEYLDEYLFQRSIYAECNGCEKYWNLIDDRLEFIRSKAGNSTVKITRYAVLLVISGDHKPIILIYRAFNDILKTDRARYGTGEDYVITDVIADEWQQRVDNVVGGVDTEDA